MTHEWYFLRPSQDDMTGQIDLQSFVDMDIGTSSWLAGLGQPIDTLLPEEEGHKEEGTTRDWHRNHIVNYENLILFDTPGVIIQNKKVNKLQFSNFPKSRATKLLTIFCHFSNGYALFGV